MGLVLLFGCQASPEAKKDAPVTAAPAPLLFALERGLCFGRCPAYRLEVFEDGRVRFTGTRHVAVTEPVETTLPRATVDTLIRRLEQRGFEPWVDYDKPTMTDQPTVTLTWKGVTIRHNLGDERAPSPLKQLEDDLDALVGTEQWVRGTGGPTQ